ncbi:MAG: hypothetical protein A2211_10170 [Rhodanobacter sp. RIFOXYA1_FULL_67_6]|nr:MAG: hypothetical protein A2211_10170 [Rhodanobacter sp. RIFOXYA1_FULL_67_6]
MTRAQTIPHIQQRGYDAMIAARNLRVPYHPEGFVFNPYPLDSAERVNFNVGCIIAAFPKLQ